MITEIINKYTLGKKFNKSNSSGEEIINLLSEKLIWHGNSSFMFKNNKQSIYFDPFFLPEGSIKADYIILSHSHFDHCSFEDISRIIDTNTRIIGNYKVKKELTGRINLCNFITMHSNQVNKVNDLLITCLDAYNIKEPEHPKGFANGYLIKTDNISLYHAGDTDKIKEMNKIQNKVDVAILPIGGEVVMNIYSAIEAIREIKPIITIPMHYGSKFRYNDGTQYDSGKIEDGLHFKNEAENSTSTKVYLPINTRKFREYYIK